MFIFECYDCGETFQDEFEDYDNECKNCGSRNYKEI